MPGDANKPAAIESQPIAEAPILVPSKTADAPLTNHQKEIIKRYILRLVALPGAFIAIISALLGFVVNSEIDSRAENKFTDKYLPSIVDSARLAGISSGEASHAATEAADVLKDAKSKAESLADAQSKIEAILKHGNDTVKNNLSQFSQQLVEDQAFRDALGAAYKSDVSKIKDDFDHIRGHFEFTTLHSEFAQQQASIMCPADSNLVSGSCLGNNGSLQVAVGPEIRPDNTVWCYRYGSAVMPVQATAICMRVK